MIINHSPSEYADIFKVDITVNDDVHLAENFQANSPEIDFKVKLSGPKHSVRCLVTDVGDFSASFLRAVHLFDGRRSSVENEAGVSTISTSL